MQRHLGLPSNPAAATLRTPVPKTAAIRLPRRFDPGDWSSVRDQFPLTRSQIHMATFVLTAHPAPVAAAIERHRRALDRSPADCWHERFLTAEAEVRAAVADYTGGSADQIALTDSTTMGLGLVLNSVRLRPGDEIVCEAHGHYSMLTACEHRRDRDGATVRLLSLYEEPARASAAEIVASMLGSITDRTRVLAVTWVDSSTGVKAPIRAMADALAEVNQARDPEDRVLLCVDGVHGLGNQRERVADLGCDFFIAGTHKWMFGPRGTGIVWARPEAWRRLTPIIPAFGATVAAWLGIGAGAEVPIGDRMSPGGFHSFEHRWALPEAFAFHRAIGPARVHERIASLNTRCKEGLARIPGVRVHTPMAPSLSAGIISFDVDGVRPDEFVRRMRGRGIVASASPDRLSRRCFARLAPSLINDEEEVDRSLRAVADLT